MMENKDKILVSISCITYNHVQFICQCLDGMLMQKVNFKYEILIHDDASNDGTQDVIKEYQTKYSDIIKCIFRSENLFSQGVRLMNRFNYSRAKGKYIALCEGDDFWTDPNKLQRQVDFLEENPDYSMCFHNATEIWEDGTYKDGLFANISDKDYTSSEVYNRWIVPTASVVFKKEVVDSQFYIENIAYNSNIIFGDIALFISCSQYGKIHAFSDVMSVYRRHCGGMTNQISKLNIHYKYCSQGFAMASVFKKDKKLSKLMLNKSIKRTLQMYWITVFTGDREYKEKCANLIKEYFKSHFFLILFQSPVRLYMAMRALYRRKKQDKV